ncbi:MAG: hypothetical protein IJ859_00505 [Synergistaceae bacterium]|nr:hypothetical protein [Synergistaceae bacterium]
MTYVEKCLYGYKANLAELEVLYEERKNLMSLHGQTYEINNSSGEQDPVGNIVNQGFSLDKRISQLEKRVKPVDKLMKDLQGSSLRVQQMSEILRLKYINHEDKDSIKKKVAVSDITLWRRTKDLIALAKRYFPFFVK